MYFPFNSIFLSNVPFVHKLIIILKIPLQYLWCDIFYNGHAMKIRSNGKMMLVFFWGWSVPDVDYPCMQDFRSGHINDHYFSYFTAVVSTWARDFQSNCYVSNIIVKSKLYFSPLVKIFRCCYHYKENDATSCRNNKNGRRLKSVLVAQWHLLYFPLYLIYLTSLASW